MHYFPDEQNPPMRWEDERRKKGQRVFMLLINAETKEETKRWGTVESDDGSEYTGVRFDDFNGMVSPISYYLLHDDDGQEG
jgi:hypothetical protein